MRRCSQFVAALLFVGIAAIGTPARPAHAQNPLAAIKKKADEARKKIEEAKRKADSVAAAAQQKADAALGKADSAAASTGAQADAANASVDSLKQSLRSPLRVGKEGGGGGGGATPTANRRGGGPTASPAVATSGGGGPLKISRTAAKVDEQMLLPAGVTSAGGPKYFVSPREQHVAAVVLRGSRQVVVYDGVDGPKFDEVQVERMQFVTTSGVKGRQFFSDDGRRYAYLARQGNDWVVIADGKELARGSPWRQATNPTPVVERVGFTPGGKHVWFSTATGDPTKPTWQLYWDGKPEPASVTGVADQFILGLVLSPNGERYTYLITQRGSDGRQIPALVVDGKVTNWPAEQPVFTADGQHLFTKVSSGPGAGIYMDGKPFLPGQGNMDVYPAPVGDVVMIAVNMGGVGPGGRPPSYLTIGNRKVPNTDGCRGPVRFSMDGKHWAAKCGSNSGPQWVVADGKRGQEYQGIASDILFTADGRPVYRASSGDKFFVVAGDRESDAYRNYEAMQKPPDCTPGLPNCPPDLGVIELPAVVSGNHVGYIASPPQSIGFDQLVVIDGKTTRAPRPTEVTFSPDGSRFGYLADKHPVIDGGPPSEYAAVPSYRPPMTGPTIVFSPNGKHYAYVSTAPNAYEGTAIVVDGRLVPTPGVGRNLNLIWTPDSRHLMWLARSGSTPKFMVYVDGDPVLEIDAAEAGLMLQNQPFVYGSMGDDGVWTILAEVNGDVKRFRITPGAGSVESLMSRAVRTR